MAKRTLPERKPISDRLSALVTRLDDKALLSPASLGAGEVLARGDLILRYGVTFLGKPQLSIVPDLVVADYGELLVGEAMWQFLMKSAHRYPRADAFGLNRDGGEEMVALKQLDFDYPYDVFVYRQARDRKPLAKLSALIASKKAQYPHRLLAHLPRFDSVDAWRAHG
ncbi:MAG: hypothetical protein F4X02_15295 [Chloroflexi bacterium]|nr:hypothetical protein [Chloroflexota bacterium]